VLFINSLSSFPLDLLPKVVFVINKNRRLEMAGKMKLLVAAEGSVESQSVVKYVAATLPPVDTGVVFLHVINQIPETYWDFGLEIEADSLAEK
jgi:hypothetical protein